MTFMMYRLHQTYKYQPYIYICNECALSYVFLLSLLQAVLFVRLVLWKSDFRCDNVACEQTRVERTLHSGEADFKIHVKAVTLKITSKT